MARLARRRTAPPSAAELHRAVARARRHRRPVPGGRPAEAGLAQRHPRLPLDHADRFDALRRRAQGRSRPPGRHSTVDPTARPRSTPTESPATSGSRPCCATWSAGPSRCSGAPSPACEAQSPNRAVTVTRAGALWSAPTASARWCTSSIRPIRCARRRSDLWAATPVDRLEALLRDSGVEIGIVTDGRWWGLVCARRRHDGRRPASSTR